MSLYSVGVNHRSCPVALRERLAAVGSRAALEALKSAGWGEAVVVSTCNRFELFAAGESLPAANPIEALLSLVDRLAGAPVSKHAYAFAEGEAAGHLFRVVSGLDSLVVGETEILGQVRWAYEAALESGRTAKITNVLFQRALFIGKAVRSRTLISEGRVSVASVAVELARRIFGRLDSSTALVLGAGEMAEKTARHLVSGKVRRLHIANRTWEKARVLSQRLGAKTAHWDDFPALLAEVDVVVASTGSPKPIISRALVERAFTRRQGRPLFFIDIAMPRDVAEDVDQVDGVYLYALEDLQGVVAGNIARRRDDIASVQSILDSETDKFSRWLASLGTGRELSLKHSDVRGRHENSVPAPQRV